MPIYDSLLSQTAPTNDDLEEKTIFLKEEKNESRVLFSFQTSA